MNFRSCTARPLMASSSWPGPATSRTRRPELHSKRLSRACASRHVLSRAVPDRKDLSTLGSLYGVSRYNFFLGGGVPWQRGLTVVLFILLGSMIQPHRVLALGEGQGSGPRLAGQSPRVREPGAKLHSTTSTPSAIEFDNLIEASTITFTLKN